MHQSEAALFHAVYQKFVDGKRNFPSSRYESRYERSIHRERMSDSSVEEETEGSWMPFIAAMILGVIYWLTTSQSQVAVKIRRSYNMQVRIHECYRRQQ